MSERSQAGRRATGGRGRTGGATHGATCSRCLTGGREGSDGTNVGNGWMVTCGCECACGVYVSIQWYWVAVAAAVNPLSSLVDVVVPD